METIVRFTVVPALWLTSFTGFMTWTTILAPFMHEERKF